VTTKKFVIPPEVEAQFGLPPLLRGEDDSAYYTLMENFAKLIEPKDMMEWWWVKDMTDHTWEIRRLRRFKVLVVELHRDIVVQSREMLAWHDENAEYKPPPVLDGEKDSAQFFKCHINEYKNIDKLIESAERRRDRILREIEHRRENLARRLRKASEEVAKGEIVKLQEAA
jgi:hypothetical protein